MKIHSKNPSNGALLGPRIEVASASPTHTTMGSIRGQLHSLFEMKFANPFAGLPLVVMLSLLGISPVATAQNYSIDWFTMDGGAGTSAGGPYLLSGTIGQPDANQQVMTGGGFSLSGGFWSLFVVQTLDAPPLTIQWTAANTARISWPSALTGFVLQQNTNLNNVTISGWVSAPQLVVDDGTTKSIIITPPTGNRFYRLFKP